MFVSRRSFLLSGAGAACVPGVASGVAAPRRTGARPLIVSTWPFGKPANEAALRVMGAGGSPLDGVEQGIWVAESDPENASVGLSGIPNAAGFVQQDACVMWGPTHDAGSVAGVEGVVHPVTLARRVMEKTPHVMLVGEGARWFALEEGVETVPVETAGRLEAWRRRQAAERKKTKGGDGGARPAEERADPDRKTPNHDTIALLILGPDGSLAGGCSTSGWGGKLPGRVGDSPLIGGGLYVDNEVGAAGATGQGENIMRYCGTYAVVENMRRGLDPESACVEAVRQIARKDPRGIDVSVNFVALDKSGRYGAAGSGPGFSYAVTTPEVSGVLKSAALSAAGGLPVGGNRFAE